MDHAQDTSLPPNSSINAPYQKFRWLHVPGSAHQGTTPFFGPYTYTVTPRYFDDRRALKPMDKSLSVDVVIDVKPFVKDKLSVGFTRGFTQSQAFVHHFSKNALITPKNRDLVYDTSQEAGMNAEGVKYSYAGEYKWMGFTAREQIFAILDEVLNEKSLHLDVFAYDLNEPDLINILLKLASDGRIRIILDDAPLHFTKKGQKTKSGKPKGPTFEDRFTTAFNKAAKGDAQILRGHFKRFAHDKIFIVSQNNKATTVLTGSTNFSVTGLYVNSNHILVFEDADIANTYYQLFEAVWAEKAEQKGFVQSGFAGKAFPFNSANVPKTEITFSPQQGLRTRSSSGHRRSHHAGGQKE